MLDVSKYSHIFLVYFNFDYILVLFFDLSLYNQLQ